MVTNRQKEEVLVQWFKERTLIIKEKKQGVQVLGICNPEGELIDIQDEQDKETVIGSLAREIVVFLEHLEED